jgi:hypothetical protein
MSFNTYCPRPQYLEASYQGLPYWVQGDTLTINKGSARAEFPFRDTPASIDTGNKAYDYNQRGIITGDIIALAAAFREVSKLPQPHIIASPIYGLMRVGITKVEITSENVSRGGEASISIEAFEWGSLPDNGIDDFFPALANVVSLLPVLFSSRYSPLKVPIWRQNSINEVVKVLNFQINNTLAFQGSPPIQNNATPWYLSSNAVYNTLIKPILSIDIVNSKSPVACEELIKFTGVSVSSSPAQSTLDACYQTARLAVLTKYAQVIIAQDFLTGSHVLKARDAFLRALEPEMNAIYKRGDIATYKILNAFKRAFLNKILSILKTKKPVITQEFFAVTNSIKIAHEVYGDATRFKEIEMLNNHLRPTQMIGIVQVFAY